MQVIIVNSRGQAVVVTPICDLETVWADKHIRRPIIIEPVTVH